MGVIHGLDESGETINAERRQYLKHQSDRYYVRNRNRQTNVQQTATTITTPQQQSFNFTTMNGGNFDPVAHGNHSIESDDNEYTQFQQMMSDYQNAYNRVCNRKPKKSSLPEYTETLQWSKY